MPQVSSPVSTLTVATAIGALQVTATADYLVRIGWYAGREPPTVCHSGGADRLLTEAAAQLCAYAAGALTRFDLPLRPLGATFREEVWRLMQAIPYGETRSYGALASVLGSSPRAVGTACGANPLPIVIPCHRVVGHGGRLTGFSGGEGISTKAALLTLERRELGSDPALPLFARAAEVLANPSV
jgi:methylated-DNA-[protein]-cysteine S-methyltransferase